MVSTTDDKVQMVPIDRIRILNPRERGTQKFRDIVDSISLVGLKRPITVSRVVDDEGEERFDLVCGQGRLEAFQVLDQAEIPAVVLEVSEEECLLMSLVENCARRQHTSQELMRDIGTLAERGNNIQEISIKTGLSKEYVRSVLRLMRNGEDRLIAAVERNQIPITVAIEIAESTDEDIQRVFTDAYMNNVLRGGRLRRARRIAELRQRFGKGTAKGKHKPRERELSAHAMVRSYKQETEKQRAMLMKSDLTERRLLFIVSALRELFNDEKS